MRNDKCEKCGESQDPFGCRRQFCLDAAGDDMLVFIEGHDDAIMGLAEVEGGQRVVYDRSAIVRRLMRRDGMDEDGAEEFFEYNIDGSKLSFSPPIILRAC